MSATWHRATGCRSSRFCSPRDDYYGKRGLYHLSPKMGCVGLSWAWGGMAEQAVIKDYNAQPIPDDLTDEQGAMIEPAAVAMYGVDRGGVTAGSTVLVSGAGPIGALTVLAAKAAGASVIIVSEPNPNRRRIITEIAPYAVTVDPTTENLQEVVRDLTEEGVGVDVALECVGLEASLNACAQAVRRQGTVVQTGLHMKPAKHRRDALGAEGHHGRGDLVLSGADLATHRPVDRRGCLPGGKGHHGAHRRRGRGVEGLRGPAGPIRQQSEDRRSHLRGACHGRACRKSRPAHRGWNRYRPRHRSGDGP